MTPEEMRNLDAEVHAKVFGFADLRQLPVFHDPEAGQKEIAPREWLESGAFGTRLDWCYLPKYDHNETSDDFCQVVPHYSSDIAAAWPVVERLGELGFTVNIEWKGKGRGYEFTAEVSATRNLTTDGHAVGTVPEAICLAALAACRSLLPLT